MNRHLRADAIALRTTRTTVGLAAALAAIVLVGIALHALGFPAATLADRAAQRRVMIDVGENLGTIFAALSGSMAVTTEFRYGTIRPTLVAAPGRRDLLWAKLTTQVVVGAGLGTLAATVATAVGTFLLSVRGIGVELRPPDIALLLAGGAVASGLWAAIGLGVGTLVRSQVPVTVGVLVWVLFVENLVRAGIPAVGRFAPGSLAQALSGQTAATLRSPAIAGLLLAAYGAAAFATGASALDRRDIA